MIATPYDPTGPLLDGTTLLEASAGTGKTYNIEHLVVRLIAERGIPLERVLIVTFTRAATAELRERVRARLVAAAQSLRTWEASRTAPADPLLAAFCRAGDGAADGPEWANRLERAAVTYDQAAISTIHGFCQAMLQENAFESGAEFDTTLVGDARPLFTQLATDFWIRTTARLPAPVFEWLEDTKPRNLSLATLVALAVEWERAPDARLVPELSTAPAPELPDASAFMSAVEQARACCRDERTIIEQQLAAGRGGVSSGYADDMERWFRDTTAWLDGVCRPDKVACAARVGRARITKERLKTKSAEFPHPFFDLCDRLAAEGKSLCAALDAWADGLKPAFLRTLQARVPVWRLQTHQQTYGHLLYDLKQAVTHDAAMSLRAAIRLRYDAALIDEFQDTDPVQWRTFERLFADEPPPCPVYLIGDPKQAIYHFRGADVFTYQNARSKAHDLRTLATNYRSDGLLVAAVNGLFLRHPAPFGGEGIEYHAIAAHHRTRLRSEEAPLELRVLRRPEALSDKPLKTPEAEALLVQRLAADIVALLTNPPLVDAGREEPRPVKAGDVAVLVRTNAQAMRVESELRKCCVASVRHGVADVILEPEAHDLLHILRAVAEPTQRGRVRAALATRLAGRDAIDLDELATDGPRWEGEVLRIREWGALWADRGLVPAIERALRDLGVYGRALAEPGGERRLTNLAHLVELLHEASLAGHLGPAGVVSWLEDRIAEPKASIGEELEDRQLRLETDADAVQIVTVHSAKGLQYPIVYCPFLWAGGDSNEARNLRYHEDVGDRHETVLDYTRIKPNDHPGLAQVKVESAAEQVRLLYVAITRARHRCTVYWGVFNPSAKSALGTLLQVRDALGGISDDDLVDQLRDLGLPGVRVTIDAAPDEPVRMPPDPPVEVAYATFPRRKLDEWWRLASYSGLVTGQHKRRTEPEPTDGEERDGDDDRPKWERAEDVPATELIPLWGLDRNKTTGFCLHEVLEHHDFGAPEGLAPLVREKLEKYGFDPDQWTDTVTAALQLVIETPLLPSGLRLADVAHGERLNELDFLLPVAPGSSSGFISPKRLGAAMAVASGDGPVPTDYPAMVGALAFMPVRGFLKGVIDLVFRHDGAWYLVDHKSSFLGYRVADYVPERIADSMATHHYILQYHLYLVAVHRFLQHRLGDGYAYDRESGRPQWFGGVIYLYLRGMLGAEGGGAGVFVDRPPLTRVEALSELFANPGNGEAADE